MLPESRTHVTPVLLFGRKLIPVLFDSIPLYIIFMNTVLANTCKWAATQGQRITDSIAGQKSNSGLLGNGQHDATQMQAHVRDKEQPLAHCSGQQV